MNPTPLPIDPVLPEVVVTLTDQRVVLVQAPPGAGKTTRIPPALLAASWCGDHKILMLEPRRVAARAAATRMARDRGEKLGQTVGLRTRLDTQVSEQTRIEVVTEGVLTRMLLNDPGLDGVIAVVFDEFHERSLFADTGLALTLDSADGLRPDLRIVVMSATLDSGPIASALGGVPLIAAEGRQFEVETFYRPPAPGRGPIDEVPDAVADVARLFEGDILVFLPGAGSINKAERELTRRLSSDFVVHPLHGSMSSDAQDRALSPDSQGRRKVVLATSIAQTSLTIDGVTTVIDTGLTRQVEPNRSQGISRLRTVAASRAATDQRRGRAGRQQGGQCIRLWAESTDVHRPRSDSPEIMRADLTGLMLDLASWGAQPSELRWVDEPPPVAVKAARLTLARLQAVDKKGRLTKHGRAMSALGADPRIAHLLVQARDLKWAATGCDVAALLSERDIFVGRDRSADLGLRVDSMAGTGRSAHGPIDRIALDRTVRTAKRWRRQMKASGPADRDLVGALVSLAFPEFIAQRRKADDGTYLLASGAGAVADVSDLGGAQWLAIAELDGADDNALIRLAAPITLDEIELLHAERIEEVDVGGWDRRRTDVTFERQRRLGKIIISRHPIEDADSEAVADALIDGIKREGLDLLGWSEADRKLRDRLGFLHLHDPDSWPAVDDAGLLATLNDWLRPFLVGARRRRDLADVDRQSALNALIGGSRARRRADGLTPTHVTVPSGSHIPIDYAAEGGPVLAVRLQEVFGMAETPTVADGQVRVVMHLLSPAHRPMQVTADLESFWRDGYPEVRKELRGRYPKHHWPEDPTSAEATARAKPRKR